MIFLFFSSSLACLEPELELFEVWEINVRQIIIIANGINSQTPKLQTALVWVLDKLERNQKKGKSSTYNIQDDGHISSCPCYFIKPSHLCNLNHAVLLHEELHEVLMSGKQDTSALINEKQCYCHSQQ